MVKIIQWIRKNKSSMKLTVECFDTVKKDCLVYAKKYQIKSENILGKYNNKQSKLLKDLLVSSIKRQD